MSSLEEVTARLSEIDGLLSEIRIEKVSLLIFEAALTDERIMLAGGRRLLLLGSTNYRELPPPGDL